MVALSYKEKSSLISGEGQREEKKKKKNLTVYNELSQSTSCKSASYGKWQL